MAKSKRAISDHKLSGCILAPILVLFLLAATFWFWRQAVFLVQERGPAIAQKRLSYLLEREVTVKGISLTFPLQISLKEVNISPLKEGDIRIKSAYLKIKFSILSFLTGHLRPTEITILSPEINLRKTSSESLLSLINKRVATISKGAEKRLRRTWTARLKPSSWPIIIPPKTIKIVNGRVHLEDESDTIPQIDGQFDLELQTIPEKNRLAIKSALLSLTDADFFYRGLKGTISGTCQFSPKEITTLLSCKPDGGGTLHFKGKKSTSKDASRYSFEIAAADFDLKNIALLKFPLFNVSRDTLITGNFAAASPLLYGKKFDSLSASISHQNGAWSINAINLQLTANHGNIRGTITPANSAESPLAKAILNYNGDMPPNIQTYEEKLIKLKPILWQTPINLTSDITVDLASYPLQVTSMKITGNNGTFLADGSIDLFSGFMNMRGTYLKPLSPGKHTSKEIQDIATKLTFSEIVTRPVLQVTTAKKR